MRKLTTILALLAVVSLGSCKKDYTCECTTTYSDGTKATSSITYNGKKKDVKESCDALSVSTSAGSVSCDIK